MQVAVTILFSAEPLIGMVFETFSAMVLFNTGMYFEGVWSRLKTRDDGMSLPSIFLTMPCRYGFSSSFLREKVRNGNFSCSSKTLNKAHTPKQALRTARLFKINVI